MAEWIVGATAAGAMIGAQLNSLFGPSTAKILLGAVKSSQQGLLATIISVVTLLISATTVLAALEAALEQIWQSGGRAPTGIRGWLRARFLSLGFILILGFLLLVSLTLSTGLSRVRTRLAAHYAGLIGALNALDVLMSLILVSCLFALIFRYMPAWRLPWRVVLMGGLLSAFNPLRTIT